MWQEEIILKISFTYKSNSLSNALGHNDTRPTYKRQIVGVNNAFETLAEVNKTLQDSLYNFSYLKLD